MASSGPGYGAPEYALSVGEQVEHEDVKRVRERNDSTRLGGCEQPSKTLSCHGHISGTVIVYGSARTSCGCLMAGESVTRNRHPSSSRSLGAAGNKTFTSIWRHVSGAERRSSVTGLSSRNMQRHRARNWIHIIHLSRGVFARSRVWSDRERHASYAVGNRSTSFEGVARWGVGKRRNGQSLYRIRPRRRNW